MLSSMKSGKQRPRITYFPLHGRADAIRMCLSKAGVDYENKLIGFEEWGAGKEDGTFAPDLQLPFYEDEQGRKFTQHYAILRRLGR